MNFIQFFFYEIEFYDIQFPLPLQILQQLTQNIT